MALKPWHTVVSPREDLREGRPLDAAEFAVHLDKIRDGDAPADYQDPVRFFDRTHMTRSLGILGAEVMRRLSGERTETSAVFNLATQFGGGKTHALALLYHLAKGGTRAAKWAGVQDIVQKAGLAIPPEAAVAVFVGTEFDSISGRGGANGSPLRRTPWGEIAFQLGTFEEVAEHERQLTSPGGDVIRRMLPSDKPCLILIDELINYVSRSRKSGLATQMYDFLQNLSETVRGRDNIVLVVSIPSSDQLESGSAEDQLDYGRLKKLLDRLGKAVILSAETETAEIIRRRLFDWTGLTAEARKTCAEFAGWTQEHRDQLPKSFVGDDMRLAFEAAYPFHPSVLSVFERKWQALPQFQRTRGILRLLALWVSNTYSQGYRTSNRDPLIMLGSAPLSDPMFRAAAFEQLGDTRLEAAVTTDIAGSATAHATRLDAEAVEGIRKARVHQKVATTIFFESNGGQLNTAATVPEIRLAVGEPATDIGNVETALEALTGQCYFLVLERNQYRFSLSPNLNKILVDRLATVHPAKITERARAEVQKAFVAVSGVDRVFFPERSNAISDRPSLSFVVLAPDQVSEPGDPRTPQIVERYTRENGISSRVFKSALVWCMPDSSSGLAEEVRKVLAWEDIEAEADRLRLDDGQQGQLSDNVKKAGRDVKESVWRTYNSVMLLGKDNALRTIDFGRIHSSAADSLTSLILSRLAQDDEIAKGAVSAALLARNWTGASAEWSTKSVRDAFFASPKLPRLLNPDSIKETIARGVSSGLLAYVGKAVNGEYRPFVFNISIGASDVEVSEDMFIITKETAEAYVRSKAAPPPQPPPPPEYPTRPDQTGSGNTNEGPGPTDPSPVEPPTLPVQLPLALTWEGEIPPQKWMKFYTQALSPFARSRKLSLRVRVEIGDDAGISPEKIEALKAALRELGVDGSVEVS